MSGLGGISFSLPDVSGTDFSKEKEIREIKNYMALLTKQLQFTLNNLEPEENFTEEANKAWSSFVTDDYVHSEISQTADEILLKVSKEYVTNGTMEAVISQTSQNILLQVSETYETQDDAYEFRSSIRLTVDGISSTVSKKVGKDEIISSINQSAEAVTISASKINLNGITFANQIRVRTDDTDNVCVIKPGRLELGLETAAGDTKNLTVDGTNGIKLRGMLGGAYNKTYTQITDKEILIKNDASLAYSKITDGAIRIGTTGSKTYVNITPGGLQFVQKDQYPYHSITIFDQGVTIMKKENASKAWETVDFIGDVYVEG